MSPVPSEPADASGATAPNGRPDRAAMLASARTKANEVGGDASGGSAGLQTYRWSRWLHVYTSMIAFFVILFFGITGVTLNHPSWTFGDADTTTAEQGTLGVEPMTSTGDINYLGVSEWIRAEYGVGGAVNSFNSTGTQATISYRAPGYEANLIFDTDTREFTLNTIQVGWVGVMNDLHKGRYADTSWRWLIDVSGVFLVVVSITGVVMQFYLRKRRKSAYITAAVGTVVILMLGWITLH